MRELQRQRQRAKGVTLEVKSSGDADDAGADDADDGEDHGLENTFTAQTDGGEVDPNMLRYIEEQMQKQGGQSERAAGGAALDDDEHGLYTTPAHLIGKVQSTEAAELEDANRWLAGIQEVSLSAEDKMANIEQTELAKRKMMAAKVSARARHATSLPPSAVRCSTVGRRPSARPTTCAADRLLDRPPATGAPPPQRRTLPALHRRQGPPKTAPIGRCRSPATSTPTSTSTGASSRRSLPRARSPRAARRPSAPSRSRQTARRSMRSGATK